MHKQVQPGTEPVSVYLGDPFRTGYIKASRDSAFQIGAGTLEFATVADVIPHARCYRLNCAMRGSARGYALSSTSCNTATGTNDINLYQIGTAVLVYFPVQSNRGLILGALPPPVWDTNIALPPSVVPGSDVGATEAPFTHMTKGEDFNGKGFGVENFSAGAPTDNVPGDWGLMNETGSGFLVSKFMAMLRASDNCGLSVFYLDQLMRLHGYNYEHFTSSSEHRIYNDEQEVHDVHFRSKFPWEALGLSKHGTNPFQTAEGKWEPGTTDAYYEPQNDKQTGIWRDVELRGYLGDLHREVVAVPDSKFDATPITYDDNKAPAYTGLSEITRSANGSIGIRSAKEILLSKYVMIPVPQQTTLPDDNVEGDWRKNYKASNEVGDGTAAEDMNDFKWTPESDADMKPALLLDYMTWVFNFHKFENLLAHKKDWKVCEETERASRWTLTRAYIEASKLSALDGSYWADMPKKADIDIDSRLKQHAYYESMSCFSMLDDGSVVIEDGWGSSIVMHRGNIQICCAGDIFMRPGRSFYAFAPKDAMLRAGGSVDLTATTHDVRLKAERNLQLLAGNDSDKSDKVGGILLESRSSGTQLQFDQAGEKVVSGGIVFKCKNSDLVGWANNIYLGTKQLDQNPAGEIMLSADEGKQNILMQANVMMRDIKQLAIDRFSPTRANIFLENATIIDTQQLLVRGSGYFTRNGNIYAEGNVGAGGSVIAEGAGVFGDTVSDGADSPHMVAPNNKAPKGKVKPVLKSIDRTAQSTEQNVSGIVEQTSDRFQSGEGSIGSAETAKKVNFSLRTDDDYNVRDFKVFAARWQQLLKEAGVNKAWEERPVLAGSDTTYPFPGRQKYEGGDAFYPTVLAKYFKLGTGEAEARGEDGGVYKDRQNESQSSAQGLNQYIATVAVE